MEQGTNAPRRTARRSRQKDANQQITIDHVKELLAASGRGEIVLWIDNNQVRMAPRLTQDLPGWIQARENRKHAGAIYW